MVHLRGEYNFNLNSADKYDPELPLVKPKAYGGTMVLWKLCLDSSVTIHPVSSPSILPIIFSPPNNPVSIHVSVYLPTHGQDNRFVEELSSLVVCLQELSELFPQAPIYLRGDFNVNVNNSKRSALLRHFCKDLALLETKLQHKTYHHFTGNGRSDSNLDKLISTKDLAFQERVSKVICKLDNPAVDSHHDMILSVFELPVVSNIDASKDNIEAPKVANNRRKVMWSDDGIESYQSQVVPELQRLQDLWFSSNSSSSKTLLSLLCESTNNVLSKCAINSNKSVKLDQKPSSKSKPTPLHIRQSAHQLLKKHKCLQRALQVGSSDVPELRSEYTSFRSAHRRLVREQRATESIARDEAIYQILSDDPSNLFKRIKSSKRGKSTLINKLSVGHKVYCNESVSDGFYDSISTLKSRDCSSLESSETFNDFSSDYENILKICENGAAIPPISENEAFDLLMKMKADVSDYFGVTPNHYSYAGPAGWKHFHLLLSFLIDNVNNTDIIEVNIVYACILFKGHDKDKNSDRSYRTISTCPVIAKALDTYIRDINIQTWNSSQSECQFQGEGSSHELASLLVTECIQYSLHHLKMTVFILLLDAKSAFDIVLKELLIKNLFFTGTSRDTLLYLNNRLSYRQTFLDWSGQVMGPISDEQGLEQGGVSSSDFYKIFSQ